MAIQPITPAQARFLNAIPDQVIQAFNEAICTNMAGKKAKFEEELVVQLIVKAGITRKEIYENNYLTRIRTIFEIAGWEVSQNTPWPNESFPRTFTFTEK